jgi:hypothetical protein
MELKNYFLFLEIEVGDALTPAPSTGPQGTNNATLPKFFEQFKTTEPKLTREGPLSQVSNNSTKGATTLRIMTPSIMTFSIMMFSIMTLSFKKIICGTQHNNTPYSVQLC